MPPTTHTQRHTHCSYKSNKAIVHQEKLFLFSLTLVWIAISVFVLKGPNSLSMRHCGLKKSFKRHFQSLNCKFMLICWKLFSQISPELICVSREVQRGRAQTQLSPRVNVPSLSTRGHVWDLQKAQVTFSSFFDLLQQSKAMVCDFQSRFEEQRRALWCVRMNKWQTVKMSKENVEQSPVSYQSISRFTSFRISLFEMNYKDAVS